MGEPVIVSQADYYVPLLRLLADYPDGSADSLVAIEDFRIRYGHRMTREQLDPLGNSSRQEKWDRRVRWAGLKLEELQYLEISRNGIWKITDRGRSWLSRNPNFWYFDESPYGSREQRPVHPTKTESKKTTADRGADSPRPREQQPVHATKTESKKTTADRGVDSPRPREQQPVYVTKTPITGQELHTGQRRFKNEKDYHVPILQIVAGMPNGLARWQDVLAEFIRSYDQCIPPEQMESSGMGPNARKWEAYAARGRDHLRDSGYLVMPDRWFWQITQMGRRWLTDHLNEAPVNVPDRPESQDSATPRKGSIPTEIATSDVPSPGLSLDMLEKKCTATGDHLDEVPVKVPERPESQVSATLKKGSTPTEITTTDVPSPGLSMDMLETNSAAAGDHLNQAPVKVPERPEGQDSATPRKRSTSINAKTSDILPSGLSLDMLERTRAAMGDQHFRPVWGELYDQLLAAERAKMITEASDSDLTRAARWHVRQIQDYLQGRNGNRPKSDQVCDWIYFCYQFSLYREAAALFLLVNPTDVDPWFLERTRKIAIASRLRL